MSLILESLKVVNCIVYLLGGGDRRATSAPAHAEVKGQPVGGVGSLLLLRRIELRSSLGLWQGH